MRRAGRTCRLRKSMPVMPVPLPTSLRPCLTFRGRSSLTTRATRCAILPHIPRRMVSRFTFANPSSRAGSGASSISRGMMTGLSPRLFLGGVPSSFFPFSSAPCLSSFLPLLSTSKSGLSDLTHLIVQLSDKTCWYKFMANEEMWYHFHRSRGIPRG